MVETVAHRKTRAESLQHLANRQTNLSLSLLPPSMKYSIYIFQPRRREQSVLFHRRIIDLLILKQMCSRGQRLLSPPPNPCHCSLVFGLAVINVSVISTVSMEAVPKEHSRPLHPPPIHTGLPCVQNSQVPKVRPPSQR